MVQLTSSAVRRPLKMEVDSCPETVAAHRAHLDRFRQNARIFDDAAREIESRHPGKYICIAGQELFANDTLADALAAARQRHPNDDAPFVHYVPEQRTSFLGGAVIRLKAQTGKIADRGRSEEADAS